MRENRKSVSPVRPSEKRSRLLVWRASFVTAELEREKIDIVYKRVRYAQMRRLKKGEGKRKIVRDQPETIFLNTSSSPELFTSIEK